VTPGNVEELQAALAILLRDQAFRDRYAKSALKRVECFSLDSHVAKMVEIFENTLALGNRAH
jgi:glycosyltransferase involved in cell wall biosynthesis